MKVALDPEHVALHARSLSLSRVGMSAFEVPSVNCLISAAALYSARCATDAGRNALSAMIVTLPLSDCVPPHCFARVPIPRGLAEHREAVGELPAHAREHAVAIRFGLERRAIVGLSEEPVATDRPRIASRPIDELIDRAAVAEIRAAQRGVGDDAAGRHHALAGLARHEIFGRAVARLIRGVVHHVPALIRPAALHAVDAIAPRRLRIE